MLKEALNFGQITRCSLGMFLCLIALHEACLSLVLIAGRKRPCSALSSNAYCAMA